MTPKTELQQAFPRPRYSSAGMTLRDWFAGQALAGMLANKVNPFKFAPDDDATYCYKIADAMLAQREKQP